LLPTTHARATLYPIDQRSSTIFSANAGRLRVSSGYSFEAVMSPVTPAHGDRRICAADDSYRGIHLWDLTIRVTARRAGVRVAVL